MKFQLTWLAMIGLLVVPVCVDAQSDDKGSGTKTSATKFTPVPIENGIVKLTPKNSKIEFIGIHVGDKPDPRLGGFEKFDGEIKLAADKSVESVKLNIDISSVWTQFSKLTAHLKNADFFETDKFATAKFESTSIVKDSNGMKVTGNLTLHGVTQEITLPVKGKLDEAGLLMMSEFQLDRTLFGMNKMTSGVDKSVSVKFVVGQPTMKTKAKPGPGTTSDAGSNKTEVQDIALVKLSAPNML